VDFLEGLSSKLSPKSNSFCEPFSRFLKCSQQKLSSSADFFMSMPNVIPRNILARWAIQENLKV
jgi:hypothetical protein